MGSDSNSSMAARRTGSESVGPASSPWPGSRSTGFPTSTAWITMRCFDESFGWQAVSVRRLSPDVVEHVGVARADDQLLGHLVAERALQGLDLDDVADLHLVDVVERRAPGGAVAGDGRVAGLAGQRRLGVVRRAPLELRRCRCPRRSRSSCTPIDGMLMLAHRLADRPAGGWPARSRASRVVGSVVVVVDDPVVAVVGRLDHAAVVERLLELVLRARPARGRSAGSCPTAGRRRAAAAPRRR